MFVLRSTMEAKLKEQQAEFLNRLSEISKDLGKCLCECSALEKQLSAWIFAKAELLTPEQFAAMFWSQDNRWQAQFFNAMEGVATAAFESRHKLPGQMMGYLGVPAGEPQWCWMSDHLDESGWETVKAIYDHAEHARATKKD